VLKPEFRLQSEREWSRTVYAPQLLNKALMTRRAVREVRGKGCGFVFGYCGDGEPLELRC
jgi:hypothetical protein